MTVSPPSALIAVGDKSGLPDFAAALVKLGWRLYATTGTRSVLQSHGVPAESTAALGTGPEILGGRVKTLDRAVFAGLLYRRGIAEDEQALATQDFQPIDMLITTPYQVTTALAEDPAHANAIDVGGPAMLRAAAKNHASVFVLHDPTDYEAVLTALQADDGHITPRSLNLRRQLAIKTFRMLAAYDTTVADMLERVECAHECS